LTGIVVAGALRHLARERRVNVRVNRNSPPCVSDGSGDEPHDILSRRLKAAGVSIYHPDPASALLEAEKVSP